VLEELHIRGLGVIQDATLPLGVGLTVVTGETGAGKTMVVTGLLLLFGGRADSAQVRSGANSASVDGRVRVSPGSAVAERPYLSDCSPRWLSDWWPYTGSPISSG
jgi:DNA repair protein RecN (Recombination protein N)